ncbi:MAG: hypothetical protein CME17_05090 [Gemmatimonadetes bacterium]|nr:hypothetical protein [Gemmatimonadota bacterium]
MGSRFSAGGVPSWPLIAFEHFVPMNPWRYLATPGMPPLDETMKLHFRSVTSGIRSANRGVGLF